jgi:hypothetical protein
MNFKSFKRSFKEFRFSGWLFFISLLLILFICNYWTYLRIKSHPNYTLGKIVKTWKPYRAFVWHSKYTYNVNQKQYSGEIFGQRDTNKVYLIVFDNQNPRYSTIVDYPYNLINSEGKLIYIDFNQIDYDWQRYIPNYELWEWTFGNL